MIQATVPVVVIIPVLLEGQEILAETVPSQEKGQEKGQEQEWEREQEQERREE